ncbi:MAG: hypothetical protein ACI85O_000938 [Saprospiraceae bacterium]|jgi:hypothetical protein
MIGTEMNAEHAVCPEYLREIGTDFTPKPPFGGTFVEFNFSVILSFISPFEILKLRTK